MRLYHSIRWLFLIVSAFLSTCVEFIKDTFAPLVRSKGPMTHVAVKLSAVAYSAKSWLYAMFSRWRVDSYGIA